MASVSAGDRVLWAESISKTYDGSRYQFKDITVSIPSGAKIALLGANGGKDRIVFHCSAIVLMNECTYFITVWLTW
jgi:ATPase subunit of ABC transporter with duplicated ATPase domains